MALFPGFMFHMRRSQFVQVFGNSPDETAYARIALMKETVQHCMLMVQPELRTYMIESWEQGIVRVEPAVLDVQSVVPGSILFLDTYFYVVVYHGNDIARWRQEGYARIYKCALHIQNSCSIARCPFSACSTTTKCKNKIKTLCRRRLRRRRQMFRKAKLHLSWVSDNSDDPLHLLQYAIKCK